MSIRHMNRVRRYGIMEQRINAITHMIRSRECAYKKWISNETYNECAMQLQIKKCYACMTQKDNLEFKLNPEK